MITQVSAANTTTLASFGGGGGTTSSTAGNVILGALQLMVDRQMSTVALGLPWRRSMMDAVRLVMDNYPGGISLKHARQVFAAGGATGSHLDY